MHHNQPVPQDSYLVFTVALHKMEAEKENILEAVGTKKTTAMDEETLKMLNGGVLPASSRNGDNSSGHQKDTLHVLILS